MNTWQELIADAVEAKRGAARRLREVKAAKAGIMADLHVAAKVADGAAMRQYLDTWEAGITATIELVVADLKTDPVLLATLERALMVGEATRSWDNVNEWQAERVYCFTLPNGGRLKVEASLKADGVTCRKVQVGVTTQVIPTYELRCD